MFKTGFFLFYLKKRSYHFLSIKIDVLISKYDYTMLYKMLYSK